MSDRELEKEMARRIEAKLCAELDAEIERVVQALNDRDARRKVTGLLSQPASHPEEIQL